MTPPDFPVGKTFQCFALFPPLLGMHPCPSSFCFFFFSGPTGRVLLWSFHGYREKFLCADPSFRFKKVVVPPPECSPPLQSPARSTAWCTGIYVKWPRIGRIPRLRLTPQLPTTP